MDPIGFTHLHVHTDASKIDGLGTVHRLVEAAAAKGFKALAITDHGSLANSITFVQACQQNGIKPILGVEGYVEVEGVVGHITVLADGIRGFRNLVLLNNSGQNSPHSRPAFKLDALLRYHEHLLVLSGCPASPLQSLPEKDAIALGRRLKSVFGPRLFAETMFVSETPTWIRSQKLSRELQLPYVTTNDTHFAYQEDADIHTILTQLKASFSYESKFLWLATQQEILKRLHDRGMLEAAPIAMAGFSNSAKIAAKIGSMSWDGTPTLPTIENARILLKDLAFSGLERASRSLGWSDSEVEEARVRTEYELSIIEEMNYETYFLILHDMVAWAKRNSIRVGPGRGSGAGSIVLYFLGITEVNPLLYDLSFERFLNPKRKGMPDVDVDFDSAGRHEVIKYAISRWGAYPVATYSRYSHKMIIHDLSKYFRLPRDVEIAATDEDTDGPNFQQLCKSAPLFKPTYDAINGQIRHMGKHAGGIIITDADVPLERTSGPNRILVAAWTEGTNKELTTAGIVKYDILGLSALSILKRLEDKHGFRAPDLKDNDPVFDLFKKGDLGGIFQFSGSNGIIEYTKQVAPSTFEDIVAINALYRPGALDAGTAKNYPMWRKAPRNLDPLIDPILNPTYGVMVYQEQVQAVYAALTDGDLASADEARRAISKTKPGDPKWESQLAELETHLFEGARAKGIPDDLTAKIWHEMKTHTRYSFNKSHSVAYAKVACDMAWWKYHHPLDFYCALLTVDVSEQQRYIFEIVEKGIKIAPPHVHISTTEYIHDGETIYMPMTVIKWLSAPGVEALMEARPFSSIKDMMQRVPKKLVRLKARLGLWQLNAFKDIEGTPADLQVEVPIGLTRVQKHMAYMGFMIPPVKALQLVNEAVAQGYIAGVIHGKIEKESQYGKYWVYYLLPRGSVWSRTINNLEIGQWVKIKHKKSSGKIYRVEALR